MTVTVTGRNAVTENTSLLDFQESLELQLHDLMIEFNDFEKNGIRIVILVDSCLTSQEREQRRQTPKFLAEHSLNLRALVFPCSRERDPATQDGRGGQRVQKKSAPKNVCALRFSELQPTRICTARFK